MTNVIIETIVSILANLAVTLIGVAGAWLMAQIGKSQHLNTINAAIGELTAAAETTVLELQQTVVDDLKAASAWGKLDGNAHVSKCAPLFPRLQLEDLSLE